MRRGLATLAFALIVLIVVVLLATSSGGQPPYRAAALFDTAKGIVPGQLVKIAGAEVGTISKVRLEPGPTALIEFSVPRRFAPFRADARCQILPEGPISENYVQCSPGSPREPSLSPADGDGVPTVPVSHTSVPVSLQDVLNIFSLPVDERLSSLINELGIGTAGEGTDINAILRRANPALQQGDRVLSILDAQNQRVATAVGQTNAILGQLAQRSSDVRAFVDRAAAVSSTTALHRVSLANGVSALPGLLHQLDVNLAPIDRVAVDGTPLLAELRTAAPGLTLLTHTLPAFTRPGVRAIRSLSHAATAGQVAVRAASPVATQLARLAATAPPVLNLLDQLLVSTRDRGGFEGLLRLLYSFATDASGYDSTSHFVSALVIPFANCIALATTPGCSHAYDSPGQGSIPVNDPAAGPQVTSAAVSGGPSKLKPLLRYLLK